MYVLLRQSPLKCQATVLTKTTTQEDTREKTRLKDRLGAILTFAVDQSIIASLVDFNTFILCLRCR